MRRAPKTGAGAAAAVTIWLLTAGCGAAADRVPTVPPSDGAPRLVAFGHSYVEGRQPDPRIVPWPEQAGRVLGLPVVNAGAGGTTSDLIEQAVARYRVQAGDQVVIEAVTNDVGRRGSDGLPAYRAAIRRMVAHLTAGGVRPARILLLADPPIPSWSVYTPDAGGSNEVLRRYATATRRLAGSLGARFADLGRGWSLARDIAPRDRLHPSAAGTRRIRDLVVRALRR